MLTIVTRPALALALIVAFLTAGCAVEMSLLGGRSKCWGANDPRAASLWRGTLEIDNNGAQLDTPEGDVIPLAPGTLWTRIGQNGVGELVHGAEVVAREGDDVTLFGGAGSDGSLVVCSVEENRGAA